MLLPWCIVCALIKTFLFDVQVRSSRDVNRACMYYLDIPVFTSDRVDYETLRVLKQPRESNQGSRNVRPKTVQSSVAESSLKITPYDCCSYQGQRDVSFDSLLSIFRPLDELAENAQVRFRTLSKCNWDSAAGVA